MVNFSVDQIRELMDKPTNIRNISVIAHVDHGKSTLTDSLIAKAGIIAEARSGEARFMDTRDDEQARSITIKATAVTLFYNKKAQTPDEEDRDYLINLIDSPGHVDFSSEVTAALRVTDGALVVVDCVEGVCVQTETVLRQALGERIKPVLFLNKLDRVFLELQCDMEEAYQNFRSAIESANVVIATYHDDALGDVQVTPENGTVGFGSGLHAWGFTLRTFANMYAAKFGVPVEKLMKKLWGENYFDAKKKKWSKKAISKDGTVCVRGFCQFVLSPLSTLFKSMMNEETDVYEPMLKKLKIRVPDDAVGTTGKPLMKAIMRTWLPAGDALLDMICTHLPSPKTAQAYRLENLYTGPLDDPAAEGIRACNPDAPLVLYISKMVPTSDKGRFYAFGRVFSGKVATGQQVRIMTEDYKPGGKKGLYVKKIQRTVLMMGRYTEQVSDMPCGNVVGLVGVDQYILKTATISTYDEAFPIRTMSFSVSAVVRVAVEPTNASDLPKLVEGLKRLSKSDPLVQISTSKTGEHIIAGAGELHLEVCLKDLREQYLKGAPVKVSDPVVSFAESVGMTRADYEDPANCGKESCMGKSPNKHNRIRLWAEDLGDEVTKSIEENEVTEDQDFKERARILKDKYEWHPDEARKIWTFGCVPDARANLLVDMTKAVQYLHEIKDSCIGAFMQATAGGAMCDEVLRGCRFNLDDVTLHADAIHRGAGQIMPPMKRAIYASQLKFKPRLQEPMYLVDITVPQSAIAGVYNTLSQRRGTVEDKVDRIGTPLCQIKAFLPVMESFGFTSLLRQNTGGQAFPQMVFSHWSDVAGNPLDEGCSANKIMMGVRERKGLKMVAPKYEDYHDRL